MIRSEKAIRALSTLRTAQPTSSFFRQIRHAEVVNTPSSILFGGHHNNWGRKHTKEAAFDFFCMRKMLIA